MKDESLISISEASNLMGVSESALRQWTDEGKIKALITPGGHRRYAKADLIRLTNSHQKSLKITDLVSKIEDTADMHRDIAQLILQTPWYNKLNAESQKQLAFLGRYLLSLLIEYISEPANRDQIIKLVRETGQSFGETLAKLELPLTDSVETFLLHRNPIINAATDLMKKRGIFPGRIAGSIALVGQVLDQALVSLVDAHQKYMSGTKGVTLK